MIRPESPTIAVVGLLFLNRIVYNLTMNMISINGRDVHSSKNSRRNFGRVSLKSKAATADEGIFALQLNLQWEKWEKMLEGREFPLVVVFRLRRGTKRAFDYNNILQGVLDAMEAVGYLENDNMKNIIPIPAPWVHDKANPGVDFWIANEDDYRRLTHGSIE